VPAGVVSGRNLACQSASRNGDAKKTVFSRSPAHSVERLLWYIAPMLRPFARLVLSGLLLASPALAEPPPPAPRAAAPSLHLAIERFTLTNGLRVVLAPDPSTPTVAVNVLYDVGSRNEERGRSGFAHLFEHMMFQGSANVPRGQHFQLVSGHGGQMNGTTSADRTQYFEMMPRSELPLALWLEADRMKSLDVSDKNLDNQRSVVKEEYRMRVENAAYVPADLRLSELVFQGYWPYEHSTIGSMRDLDAAQLDWVRAFHAAYYGPNNAVLAISGDFDPAEAKALVARFFGDAPRIPSVPAYEPGPLAEQTTPRDAVVVDAHAELPAVLVGWAAPAAETADHDALEMVANLLTDGESSRLYRGLVRERGIAVEVDASLEGHHGPDELEITVKGAAGASAATLTHLVDDELLMLGRTGPSPAEMAKLRRRAQAHFLLGLQSNLSRAQQLGAEELYSGDANRLNTKLDRKLAVTPDDMRRVVGKYLTRARQSTVEVKPARAAGGKK